MCWYLFQISLGFKNKLDNKVDDVDMKCKELSRLSERYLESSYHPVGYS